MQKLRRILVLALAVVATLTFSACAASFDYDKTAAENRAREVVDVINTRDYDAIYNLFREDLKPLTSAADFQTAWEPYLSVAGGFTAIQSISTVGQTEKSGDKYIVAVAKCAFENKTYLFTIVMDTELNVAGLYLK